MKVELLKTLKGSHIWVRGTVFDDTVAPIPRDILKEADSGASTVKVTATEKPIVAVEPKIEKKKPVTENDFENLPVTADEAERIKKVFETVEQAQEKPQTTQEKLGRLIKHYGSKKKAAAALGVPPITLTRWEKGTQPKPESVERINDAFAGINHDL